MKSYSELQSGENGKAKCSLFDRLKDAIDFRDIEAVKAILTSKDKYLQEVLGTSITENNADGTADSFTFLTYAIEYNSINVAHTILDTTDKDDLKKLLNVESRIYYSHGAKKFTALSFAEENGYTDLAEKIEGKMKELKIPILRKENKTDPAEELRRMQESLKKEHESDIALHRAEKAKSAREFEEKIERLKIEDSDMRNELERLKIKDSDARNRPKESEEIIRKLQIKLSLLISDALNNLPWAVLYRNGKTANNLLESLRNLGRKDLGDKMAQALAEKGNKEIIKEIQTRQAFVISIIGLVIVVLAAAVIATIIFTAPVPMTTAPIIGIVIAGVIEIVGLTLVGLAGYHGLKEIPDSQVEEVGADNPAQANLGAKGT